MKNRLKFVSLFGIILMICQLTGNAQINQDKISVRKIWSNEYSNTCGDILYFKGDYYCSFQQGFDHAWDSDGKVRIIKSKDKKNWESIVLLEKQGYDLRNPKLSITPDGRIMVIMGGSVYKNRTLMSRLTHVSFSNMSGEKFSYPQFVNIDEKIRTKMDWIWRVSWYNKTGYGVVSQLPGKISLLKTVDGINYDLIKDFEDVIEEPDEATVKVMPDGEMIMMVRCATGGGLWGRSQPPYEEWSWVDSGIRFGEHDFAALNDSLFIAGIKVYGGSTYTGLFLVSGDGKFRKILRLPSGGDNGCLGFVVVKDKIYMAYYSSHEGNSSIYWTELSLSVVEEMIKAPPIVKSTKIWNDAYCSFTDLVRFKGKFYCTLREGQSHAGGDLGTIRVIESDDGSIWKSAALIEEKNIDLRDPKLSVMPNGKLMLMCGGSDYYDNILIEWQTRVAYSENGTEWTRPLKVKGIPSNNWSFGITWLHDTGYIAPRICKADPETGKLVQRNTKIIIYKTADGLNYEQISEDISESNFPCNEGCGEAVIKFKKDSTMVVLARTRVIDDYGHRHEKGILLFSKPPYENYNPVEIEHGMGGPALMYFEDDSWLVGTRESGNERPEGRSGTATVLLLVDEVGIYKRLFEFPSGGDTSYPGMIKYDGKLWFSYYSSHEGKAAVYLSVIPISEIN